MINDHDWYIHLSTYSTKSRLKYDMYSWNKCSQSQLDQQETRWNFELYALLDAIHAIVGLVAFSPLARTPVSSSPVFGTRSGAPSGRRDARRGYLWPGEGDISRGGDVTRLSYSFPLTWAARHHYHNEGLASWGQYQNPFMENKPTLVQIGPKNHCFALFQTFCIWIVCSLECNIYF